VLYNNNVIYYKYVDIEAAAAKPKISFLSKFPLRGGGVGGEPQIKMIGNFLVLPRASKARAGEAQRSVSLKIGSDLVV
jgi:hypothetical protein